MPFKKKNLGKTGLQVPPFAIGGGYGAMPRILDEAFESGLNTYFYAPFFPTYTPMTKWLRSRFPARRDEHILITTSYFWRIPGALERTLKRHLSWLRADYIDVFMLGWIKSADQERAFETLEKMKEKKLFKYIGISAHTRKLFPEVMKKFPVDVVMTRYNFAHRGAEKEVFPFVKKEGVIAFNALKHGRILRKFRGWDESNGKFPTAAEAYRYALSNPAVHMCLAGPNRSAHVESLRQAMAAGPLDKKRIADLSGLGDFIHG